MRTEIIKNLLIQYIGLDLTNVVMKFYREEKAFTNLEHALKCYNKKIDKKNNFLFIQVCKKITEYLVKTGYTLEDQHRIEISVDNIYFKYVKKRLLEEFNINIVHKDSIDLYINIL
jgi:hypothetical protein